MSMDRDDLARRIKQDFSERIQQVYACHCSTGGQRRTEPEYIMLAFALNQRNAKADYLGELNIILDASTVEILVKGSPEPLGTFKHTDYLPIILEGIVQRLDQEIPDLVRRVEPDTK